jgi:hypothetical protein
MLIGGEAHGKIVEVESDRHTIEVQPDEQIRWASAQPLVCLRQNPPRYQYIRELWFFELQPPIERVFFVLYGMPRSEAEVLIRRSMENLALEIKP